MWLFLQPQRQLLLRADRAILRATRMVGPLGNTKHREARATQALRRNSPPRNSTVTGRARVGRMLGAPRSRSAHARCSPGARGVYQP